MKYLKYTLTLLIIAFVSSCGDTSLNPINNNTGGESGPSVGKAETFGLVEVTITGIGTDQMTASAQSVIPRKIVPGAAALTRPGGSGTSHTIQMKPSSNGSYTVGTRPGGYRYIWATFRVRNAEDVAHGSTAYSNARTNLTFLAVDTDASFGTDETYGHTAISLLRKFNGDEMDPSAAESIARNTRPTGRIAKTAGDNIKLVQADVLQVFTEDEITALTPPAGVRLFPYGFMARKWEGSRTLSPNPNSVNFEGYVTFAFKVPLQAQANQDPFEISAMFLPMDDSETRMTESLEEQKAANINNIIAARAKAINAKYVTVFPGTTYQGMRRLLCDPVRISGWSGDPMVVTIPSSPPSTVQSVTPAPYNGGRSHIAQTQNFSATFSGPANISGLNRIVVRGSQSGRQGLNFHYVGNSSSVGTSAPAHFMPGEIVEVSFTAGLGICPGYSYRYRVAAGGTGTIFNYPDYKVPVNKPPTHLELGDINGDEKLDAFMVTHGNHQNDDFITVLLNNGSGNFTAVTSGPIKDVDSSDEVALGDLNSDGHLDVAITNSFPTGTNTNVYLGDGSGGFTKAAGWISVGTTNTAARKIALGDVDADGDLDMVFNNAGQGDYYYVYLGDGTGEFAEGYTGGGTVSHEVALGDVNNDKHLDIVLSDRYNDEVVVQLGDGTGEFSYGTNNPASIGKWTKAVKLGDLNLDGNLDIVELNKGPDNTSDKVNVFLGDGTGGFTAATGSPFTVEDASHSLMLGDINADNYLDITTISAASYTRILGSSSGFSMSHLGPISMGSIINYAALGDMDDDGDLDLVMLETSANKFRVSLNE